MDAQTTSPNLPGPSPTNSGPSPTTSATNGIAPAAKKRRASTSGSRGVANLTPEQLAKKRANDREAQRAIRERTKGQIETLERKIQELTSQQPYQDLQHVIRQKELVEAENEDIKRKLSQVLSIIQPLLGEIGTPAVGTFPPCSRPPQTVDLVFHMLTFLLKISLPVSARRRDCAWTAMPEQQGFLTVAWRACQCLLHIQERLHSGVLPRAHRRMAPPPNRYKPHRYSTLQALPGQTPLLLTLWIVTDTT